VATACLLLLVTGAYYFGLQGPFLFDDTVNITNIPAMALRDLSIQHLRDVAFSSGYQIPDRGLARLSFALNYYLAGGTFSVLAFKLTNLGIHVLNALLLWFISQRLLARFARYRNLEERIAGHPWWQWAALFSALIWVLHPLQLTAVLYIVQRMTSLSALFCLLGLAVWIAGRERLERDARWALVMMAGGVFFGVILGVLSKENAILLPFYALITELVFFRRGALRPPALRLLKGFFLLFAVIPALLTLGVIIWQWNFIAADYQGRSFTMAERLLTESRVLWYYLQLLIFPNAHSFGIFHDDFTLSRGLLTPPSTLIAVLAWFLVTGLAIVGLFRQRLYAFAILWYLIGHSIESSFIGLELVFEHRNYLPDAAVILVACVYLLRGLMAISDKPALRLAIPGLMVLVLAGVTFSRANVWEHAYTLTYIGVKNHPNSARFNREFAAALSRHQGNPADVFRYLQSAVRLAPTGVTGLFEMSRIINRLLLNAAVPQGVPADPKLRFDVLKDPLPTEVPALLAYDDAIDREVKRRARTGKLLVSAAEVGRYTQSCLEHAYPLCERMQNRVAVWIKLFSENPYLYPSARAINALAYARIMAASGKPLAAIESIDKAIRLLPTTMRFRLEKAMLYKQFNQLDAADRVLDEARRYLTWTGNNRMAFEWVREQIKEQRQARHGETSASPSPG